MDRYSMRRVALGLTGLLAGFSLACTDDGGSGNSASGSESGSETASGDGDGDSAESSSSNTTTTTGDGDGDGDGAPGDGDGAPGDGDGDGDGAPGDGDGDGDGAPGDGDGDGAPGDGDGDGDGDGAGDGDGDGAPNQDPPWLLHVRNDTDQLVKIDTDTGVETVVCDFVGNVNYPSITFGIGGELFGSRGGTTLDEIDPCTCNTTTVGNMGFTGVNGITANGLEVLRLFGISINMDVLIDVDTLTANSIVVGNGLGINIGFSGSTWSNEIQGLFAINADDDQLYHVDPGTGIAMQTVGLSSNFVTVGIEWHPANGVLYACTDAHLYSVDTQTGMTTEIGNMGHGCNNLAAPWTPVACIDML